MSDPDRSGLVSVLFVLTTIRIAYHYIIRSQLNGCNGEYTNTDDHALKACEVVGCSSSRKQHYHLKERKNQSGAQRRIASKIKEIGIDDVLLCILPGCVLPHFHTPKDKTTVNLVDLWNDCISDPAHLSVIGSDDMRKKVTLSGDLSPKVENLLEKWWKRKKNLARPTLNRSEFISIKNAILDSNPMSDDTYIEPHEPQEAVNNISYSIYESDDEVVETNPMIDFDSNSVNTGEDVGVVSELSREGSVVPRLREESFNDIASSLPQKEKTAVKNSVVPRLREELAVVNIEHKPLYGAEVGCGPIPYLDGKMVIPFFPVIQNEEESLEKCVLYYNYEALSRTRGMFEYVWDSILSTVFIQEKRLHESNDIRVVDDASKEIKGRVRPAVGFVLPCIGEYTTFDLSKKAKVDISLDIFTHAVDSYRFVKLYNHLMKECSSSDVANYTTGEPWTHALPLIVQKAKNYDKTYFDPRFVSVTYNTCISVYNFMVLNHVRKKSTVPPKKIMAIRD